VGPPLDCLSHQRDALAVQQQVSIDVDDAYFNMIHTRWGAELPDPSWQSSTPLESHLRRAGV